LAAAGGADERGRQALQVAAQILGDVRKKKSEEKRSPKTAVTRLVVRASERELALLEEVDQDLRAAGLIQQIDTLVSEALQVDVELAAAEDGGSQRPPQAE
jgi:hypothetical protein